MMINRAIRCQYLDCSRQVEQTLKEFEPFLKMTITFYEHYSRPAITLNAIAIWSGHY